MSSLTPPVTRFAPSPTGFLHIGGARTALFNWLFAKRYGGKMLLRIEDTDRERSTPEATDAIIDGLKWLGLEWNDDPIFQFSRAKRHAEVAQELLAKGHAYKCYATPEELENMRQEARANGLPMRYDGRWRNRDPREAPVGVKPVIRLKAETSGDTTLLDKVQGQVTWANDVLDDLVLLRSDGTPTYMLAVVVDDHDMGVTHIIRGDDHLTNAARQIQIYKAMGWDVPVMAHIPLIHGPDGAKLSKRHGALGVEAYREMGYLPQALRNYLVRLGWAHGDDEIMSLDDMISWFDLDGIGRSAARFDFAKLENLNGHYLRAEPAASVLQHWSQSLPFLPSGKDLQHTLTEPIRDKILQAMPAIKERAKTLNDITQGASFIWAQRPLTYDEAAQKLLTLDAKNHLSQLIDRLEKLETWTSESCESAVKSYIEFASIKLGAVGPALRVALTGKTSSPGLFDVLAILGKSESIARLKDATI